MPDYSVLASKCPAILAPAASAYSNPYQDWSTLTNLHTVFPRFELGDTEELFEKFNQMAALIEGIGRGGAGAFGVVSGGLKGSTATGLVLPISDGFAILDAMVPRKLATCNLADDTYNYVYIGRDGQWYVSYSTDPNTPPTAPAGLSGIGTFVVRARTQSGDITEVDHSGVLEFKSGIVVRRTGDTDRPTDGPPANVCFLGVTQKGTWVWDGIRYSALGDGIRVAAATTLGTVIGKEPVYNAAGTIVGYRPIYDAIT